MRQKNFLEPYLSHWTRPRCLSFLVQCSRCPWAGVILTVPDNGNHALFPVSYTHLDVYKRQLVAYILLPLMAVNLIITGLSV